MKTTQHTPASSVPPVTVLDAKKFPAPLSISPADKKVDDKEQANQQESEQDKFFRAWCCACEGYGSIF
jgi:hypothetical protein